MREQVKNRTRQRPEHLSAADTAGRSRGSDRGKLLLKQTAAVTFLIIGILLINRSSLTIAKNCVSALGRAVNHEFDWTGIFNTVKDYVMAVWRFWSEVF